MQPSFHDFPKRQAFLNTPPIVLILISVFIAIHAWQSTLSEADRLSLLLTFAFIPARTALAFGFIGFDDLAAHLLVLNPDHDAMLIAWLRSFLEGSDAKAGTLLSYAFLHGSWEHVILNSVWLLAFGTPVARRCGLWRFLTIFGVCSIAGAVVHGMTHAYHIQPLVGASAGIAGIMAAMLRFPALPIQGRAVNLDAKRLSLVHIFNDPIALGFIAIWFVINLAFGLIAPFLFGEIDIAWQAHIGGFLAGFLLFPLFDPIK